MPKRLRAVSSRSKSGDRALRGRSSSATRSSPAVGAASLRRCRALLVAFAGTGGQATAFDFLEVVTCVLAREGDASVLGLQPRPEVFGNTRLDRDHRHRVALLLED